MTTAEKTSVRRAPFKAGRMGVCKALTVALLLSAPFSAQAKAVEPEVYTPVAPTIDQARANILIARQLQFTHFRDLGISDKLSGDVFDAYLNYLDGQRVYLTGSDVEVLSKVRNRLGSALKTGQLQQIGRAHV